MDNRKIVVSKYDGLIKIVVGDSGRNHVSEFLTREETEELINSLRLLLGTSSVTKHLEQV